MLGEFTVNIEIVGTCNLKCPSCPVGNYGSMRDVGNVGGTMPIDLFERIIAKLAEETKSRFRDVFVALYSWGEPLIHPHIGQLIEIAHAAGFRVGLSSNLNYGRTLDQALAARPDEFVVSLSGFSQRVYEQSHAGGDIEVVKANMRRLSVLVEQYGFVTDVYVHYHSYIHNTGDDIRSMAQLCDQLRFQFIPGIAYYMPVENMIRAAEGDVPERDREIIGKLLVPLDAQIRIAAENKCDDDGCELISSRLDIDVDGAVKLCCASFDRANNVAPEWLRLDFDSIQSRRNSASLCGSCMHHGIQRIYLLKDLASWRPRANASLAETGSPVRFTDSGAAIDGFQDERQCLTTAIETMNAGALNEAREWKTVVDRIVEAKYGGEALTVAGLHSRIDGRPPKRGINVPVDPLHYFFVEAVLLRNRDGRQEEARALLTALLPLADSLRVDKGYLPVVDAMLPIIEEWRELPVG